MEFDLDRFVDAQRSSYADALREISGGRKLTHWMWFIFPQLQQLGRSSMAKFYGIANLEEAGAYLNHPILGGRLLEITKAFLRIENRSATDILGSPDDLKMRSSMTLFAAVDGSPAEFQQVLDRYYDGLPDPLTQSSIQY